MHRTENDFVTSAKGREGLSNKTYTGATPNVPQKPSHGRYCHIVKRLDFDGYGFNLHSEKIKSGQYIGKVDANSPAEAAGLREGDQIIQVNGVNIGSETHKQVVQRIKAISNEVRLLLLDSNADGESANIKNNSIIAAENSTNGKQNPNPEFQSPMQLTQSNLSAIGQALEESMSVIETAVPTIDQHEYLTTFTMVSTKSQSTLSRNQAVEATDPPSNGHHVNINGQAIESAAASTSTSTSAAPERPELVQQEYVISDRLGLNLNLTAAEMRAKLLAKKKCDPKNESVDLKKKFDIIQKL